MIIVKHFVVKDKTGEISVLTDRMLPSVGSQLTVHRNINPAFSLCTREATVFVEDSACNQCRLRKNAVLWTLVDRLWI